MKKWFVISLGAVIGISHLGMIGIISRKDSFPKLDLPIGPYTAYTVQANKEGYTINYRAHDPKVMVSIETVDRPAGLLGLGKKKAIVEKQYMAEGAIHTQGESGGVSVKSIACINSFCNLIF